MHCLRQHNPSLIEKVDTLYSGNADADLVNEMRDAVGMEIMAKGFLKGDPKSHYYGKVLDDLISRIAELYLWPLE